MGDCHVSSTACSDAAEPWLKFDKMDSINPFFGDHPFVVRSFGTDSKLLNCFILKEIVLSES